MRMICFGSKRFGLRVPKLDQVNPEIFDGDPEDKKRDDTEAPRHLVRRLDNVTSPRRCPDRSGKLCGKAVSAPVGVDHKFNHI